MAWDLGFKKVWLELDSVKALELIERGCRSTHPNALLVRAIIDLLLRQWSLPFSHIHRDNNKVVNYLTTLGLRVFSGFIFFFL